MSSKIKYYLQSLALVLMLLFIKPATMDAQCPMCKAAVSSSSNDGKGGDGKGSALASNLNLGILYLFVLPYGSIVLVTFVVYRSYRKKMRAKAQESLAVDDVAVLNANPSTEIN